MFMGDKETFKLLLFFHGNAGAILKSSVDGFFKLSPGPHRKLQPRKEHGKYNLSTTTLTLNTSMVSLRP